MCTWYKKNIGKLRPRDSFEVHEVYIYRKIESTKKIKQQRTHQATEQKIEQTIVQAVEQDPQLKYKQNMDGVASRYQYEVILKIQEKEQICLAKVTLTRFIEIKNKRPVENEY